MGVHEALTLDEFVVYEDIDVASPSSHAAASPSSGADSDEVALVGQEAYDKENVRPAPGMLPVRNARRALNLTGSRQQPAAAASPDALPNGRQPWLEDSGTDSRAPFLDITQHFVVKKAAPAMKKLKPPVNKPELADRLASLSLKDKASSSSTNSSWQKGSASSDGGPRPVSKVGNAYRFSMADAVRSIR